MRRIAGSPKCAVPSAASDPQDGATRGRAPGAAPSALGSHSTAYGEGGPDDAGDQDLVISGLGLSDLICGDELSRPASSAAIPLVGLAVREGQRRDAVDRDRRRPAAGLAEQTWLPLGIDAEVRRRGCNGSGSVAPADPESSAEGSPARTSELPAGAEQSSWLEMKTIPSRRRGGEIPRSRAGRLSVGTKRAGQPPPAAGRTRTRRRRVGRCTGRPSTRPGSGRARQLAE